MPYCLRHRTVIRRYFYSNSNIAYLPEARLYSSKRTTRTGHSICLSNTYIFNWKWRNRPEKWFVVALIPRWIIGNQRNRIRPLLCPRRISARKPHPKASKRIKSSRFHIYVLDKEFKNVSQSNSLCKVSPHLKSQNLLTYRRTHHIETKSFRRRPSIRPKSFCFQVTGCLIVYVLAATNRWSGLQGICTRFPVVETAGWKLVLSSAYL